VVTPEETTLKLTEFGGIWTRV